MRSKSIIKKNAWNKILQWLCIISLVIIAASLTCSCEKKSQQEKGYSVETINKSTTHL